MSIIKFFQAGSEQYVSLESHVCLSETVKALNRDVRVLREECDALKKRLDDHTGASQKPDKGNLSWLFTDFRMTPRTHAEIDESLVALADAIGVYLDKPPAADRRIVAVKKKPARKKAGRR